MPSAKGSSTRRHSNTKVLGSVTSMTAARCLPTSGRSQCIAAYRRTMTTGRLDILLIFHVHADHFNVIEQLLAPGLQVDSPLLHHFPPTSDRHPNRANCRRWVPWSLASPTSAGIERGQLRGGRASLNKATSTKCLFEYPANVIVMPAAYGQNCCPVSRHMY
jgi:hypothetical protein